MTLVKGWRRFWKSENQIGNFEKQLGDKLQDNGLFLRR